MRIDFFVLFFLTFNCYIMLIAILYMKLEKLFKFRMFFWMKVQLAYFEKFQKRVKKFNYITLLGKSYLKRSFNVLLFDYFYFIKYKNDTQKLNPFFIKEYKKKLKRKLKHFSKLELYNQYILLEVIEKVKVTDNEIQSLLIKLLNVENHFIGFKILHVIISLKKKEYFLESISYISNHHLNFNRQMLMDLFEKAIYTIPDLEIYDLLKNFNLYEEEVKKIIWINVAHNNLSPKAMKKTYEIFKSEENSYVRAIFYQFPAFDIYINYPEQFNKDFHSMTDSLRKAVIEYAEINYYNQIKDELINMLPKEKNIDIALSIVKILQKHADLKLVKLAKNGPQFLPDMINYYLMED